MSASTRWLMLVAVLLLGGAWLRPLWHIGLEAPQYPEGLGMQIWADRITGDRPHELRSINGLNHYIGMKAIVPESIPELRWMPWILGGLAVLGLAVAGTGSRRLLTVWVALFLLLAVVGLADFWRWGHDYGHNLDPTAAIRVPGMAYQPPLLGSKQLLNFRATSWPALGGIAVILSLGLGMLARWRAREPRAA